MHDSGLTASLLKEYIP